MERRDLSELLPILLDEDGRPRPLSRKVVRQVRELGRELSQDRRRRAARRILDRLEAEGTSEDVPASPSAESGRRR